MPSQRSGARGELCVSREDYGNQSWLNHHSQDHGRAAGRRLEVLSSGIEQLCQVEERKMATYVVGRLGASKDEMIRAKLFN